VVSISAGRGRYANDFDVGGAGIQREKLCFVGFAYECEIATMDASG
jgi:hypothetical protein